MSLDEVLNSVRLHEAADGMRGLNREERHNDLSGTPHGLISQAAQQKDLGLYAEMPPSCDQLIRTEYPCGPEFQRQRGYGRFIEFREPQDWMGRKVRYGLVQEGESRYPSNAKDRGACPGCGKKGAIEFGRCAICGTNREGTDGGLRVAVHAD